MYQAWPVWPQKRKLTQCPQEDWQIQMVPDLSPFTLPRCMPLCRPLQGSPGLQASWHSVYCQLGSDMLPGLSQPPDRPGEEGQTQACACLVSCTRLSENPLSGGIRKGLRAGQVQSYIFPSQSHAPKKEQATQAGAEVWAVQGEQKPEGGCLSGHGMPCGHWAGIEG